MKECTIEHASEADKDWSAKFIVRSQPWVKLGVNLQQAMATCHHPEHQVYVARSDRNLVGFIIFHPHGFAGSPYIKSIGVEDTHRSAGVGAQLIAFGENLFRSKSKHMFLCVSSFNKRAQLFYEQLGYEQVGVLKDYLLEGESEIMMHKRLK